MSRKSLKELAELLEAQKQKNLQFINDLQEDQNPQVQKMVSESVGRVDIIDDVLQYINDGSRFQFKYEE